MRKGVTIKAAVAVPPKPPSTEFTASVVLVRAPAAVAFTSTAKLQAEPAAIVPPASDTVLAPGVAPMLEPVPQPLLPEPFGSATTKPAGRMSATVTPVKGTVAFGLVMVKFNATFCPTTVAVGAKLFVIVGGATTVSDAVLLPPEP